MNDFMKDFMNNKAKKISVMFCHHRMTRQNYFSNGGKQISAIIWC